MIGPGTAPTELSPEAIERLLRVRVEPIRDIPLDFPVHEETDPPEGYEQAFLAGGRPPWPRGGALGNPLAGEWMELRLSKPTGRLVPQPEVDHRQLSQVPGSNGGAAAYQASSWQGSRNWSGAVLTARGNERISAACGRWRVPDAYPSETAPLPVAGSSPAAPFTRRVSVWVGLDGHRRIAGSMPQVGTTTMECFRGYRRWVQCYAWAQWWVRGQQYGEVVFRDLKVSPGDEVVCWLALHDPTRVTLCVRNVTTGREDGTIWRSGPAQDEVRVSVHPMAAPVAGQGAAWVVERPGVMGSTELYPLPDFGTVKIQDCIAGVGPSGPPFYEVAHLRDLGGCRLIRMFDRLPDGARTRRISCPDPLGDARTTVRVRYRG